MQSSAQALGNIAKSADKLFDFFDDSICSKTVEKSLADSEAERQRDLSREYRWDLKRAVERLMPGSRFAACHRAILPISRDEFGEINKSVSEVKILRSKENDSVFYGGLESCGSVWGCPICAAKVSERRKKELITLSEYCENNKKAVSMMTLTFPHSMHNSLADLMKRFSAARRHFFSSRSWRDFKIENQISNWAYCLETTFGENGWHVHVHFILIGDSIALEIKRTPKDLLSAWKYACVTSGLPEPNKHGLDIRPKNEAFSYINKWGLELEFTKQHIKHGKNGNRTPFDLLRDYDQGDEMAGFLYREFCSVFKGKRQIVWSRGLKDLVGLKDKTDEELIAEENDNSEIVATITKQEWRIVLKYDFRFILISEASKNGERGVRELIRYLIASKVCDISEKNSLH